MRRVAGRVAVAAVAAAALALPASASAPPRAASAAPPTAGAPPAAASAGPASAGGSATDAGTSAENARRALPPAPSDFVYDEAGWLSAGERRTLVQQLLEYERASSNQIIVAIFRSLRGAELADFSNRVANAWGIGRKEHDNGILLAIYADERKIDIEVGYGLEGKVTDLTSDLIIRERIGPAFREGRYYDGIRSAVDALIAASHGEFTGTGRARADRQRGGNPAWLFWAVFLVLMVLGSVGRRRSLLGPLILGSAMSRRGGRWGGGSAWGGFGGFGGGLGGGGGSGGTFSGGGGSFGGGGARGGW
jgi:uncharacterized protein